VFEALDRAGLNLQAVFSTDTLPESVARLMPERDRYCRLLLIAHAGPGLWQQLQASEFCDHKEPIDDYSRDCIERWLAAELPGAEHKLLYPLNGPAGSACPPLQQLGALAGWHHDSPLRIGVNERHGLWFAYRAMLFVDAELPVTTAVAAAAPCQSCFSQACRSACPVGAPGEEFALSRCIDYRMSPESPCADRCLARMACPVGEASRYPDEQIRYAYQRSLATIKAMQNMDE